MVRILLELSEDSAHTALCSLPLGIDFKTLFYTVKGEPVKVQVW